MESKKIKPSLKRDTELLFEIGTLRYLDRVWRQFLSPNVANCAEHIFRVTWIALTLAKLENKGNHEKIMKMALAHDLPETRTGDVHYISRQYTKRHEDMAIVDLFADTIHQAEMVELLAEYEERKTIEAQIVKDADYLDAELEMAELRSQGQALGRVWTESRLKKVYPTLYTQSAKKLWTAIAKADPHDWHVKSPRNRFMGGDWKKK